MKITIERAEVTQTEKTETGYRSSLWFKNGSKSNLFSLPLKLEVGSEVSVEISVETVKSAVTL